MSDSAAHTQPPHLERANAAEVEILRLKEENERLREVVRAAGELTEALLRGSPGWLDTPAGRRLVEAGDALQDGDV